MGNFRLFLLKTFEERQENNSGYSLRSFAKSLDIAHSTLSAILRGKREISGKMVNKLGRKLGLDGGELNYYLEKHHAVSEQLAPRHLTKFHKISTEDAEKLHLIDYAVLEIPTIKGAIFCKKWVANYLKKTEMTIGASLTRLVNAKLVVAFDNGMYKLNAADFTDSTSTTFTTKHKKQLQQDYLEMSIKALNNIPIEHRSHSGVTMGIKKELLPEAKKLIQNFRRELCEYLTTEKDNDEIYHLAISLFPFKE